VDPPAPAPGSPWVYHEGMIPPNDVPDTPLAPEASGTIEVTIDLTPADAGAYAEFWARHDPVLVQQMRSSRVSATAIFAAISLVIAALGLVGSTPVLWVVGLIFLLSAASAWVTWPARWRKAMHKQMMRRYESGPATLAFGPRRYVIGPEVLRYTGDYTGGYARWVAVTEVVPGASAAYVAVGGQVHIIPRRAFSAPADFDAFVALAERYRSEASPPA
jgi:hypothetical protein